MTDIVLSLLIFGVGCMLFLTGYTLGRRVVLHQWRDALQRRAKTEFMDPWRDLR